MGNANARKHGRYSRGAIQERQLLADLLHEARQTLMLVVGMDQQE